VMFYLSSLPPDAQTLGKAIRRHWSVENQLHWVLDVTFGENQKIFLKQMNLLSLQTLFFKAVIFYCIVSVL
jgi:predicted transposase YbfD/YdcC